MLSFLDIEMSNLDIAKKMLDRLQNLSNTYNILNVMFFDKMAQDILCGTNMRLEYALRKFNNMNVISENVSKQSKYFVYIKFNLHDKNTINITSIDDYNQYNNIKSKFKNGEVWDIYLQSINDVVDIFNVVGNNKQFSDKCDKEIVNTLYFDETKIYYKINNKGLQNE